MAKLVDSNVCETALREGVLVGKTTPGKDTKGSWYEVYETDTMFVAVIRSFDSSDGMYGEILTHDEIDNYMEEPYNG